MDIESSVAVVTGANRGLGRALVRAFCTAGCAKVYAAARRIEDVVGDEMVETIELDITFDASMQRIRDEHVRRP